MPTDHVWPELPLGAWRQTCETLHMFTQIVGKIRLGLAPAEPEWAHAALFVSSRGLTTSPVAFGERSFQIDFDFIGHTVDIVVSDGQHRSIPLISTSVSEFYRDMTAALRAMQIYTRIWPMPVEVPNPIRFDQDTTHASYDPEYVNRFFRILVQVDAVLKEHRAPFRHRHTLVQFFFGTFDLAYARFSGRPATPPNEDVIMKKAMDAEEICVGFWPGDARFPQPAFWCYAFPKPPGSEQLVVQPSSAFWSDELGNFILKYDDVRHSESPRDTLRAFLTSTFEAFSRLAKWDS